MSDSATTQHAAGRRDRTHFLYVAVIVAVVLGVTVGILAPDVGKALKPLGTGFVNLIKMMISPVIFCTIVLGVGSIRQAAKVGKVGGLALLYFIVMSTFALAIGLVVGNLLQPGANLNIAPTGQAPPAEAESTTEFLLGIIPTTLVSPLVGEQVLQTLFVALLVGFAVQGVGQSGAGLATLAGGLGAHRPDLVHGVGLIVGIDRFMSEARTVTNFSGNAVATVLIGKWVGEFDPEQAKRVLSGEEPFDEETMIDDEEPPPLAERPLPGHPVALHRPVEASGAGATPRP